MKTIETLVGVDWFANVGQPMLTIFPHANVIADWTAAVDSCSSSTWEDVCTESRNDLTVHLNAVCKDDFQKWNEVVGIAKQELAGPWRQMAQKVHATSLPKVVADCVEWDTMHAFVCEYYAQWKPPTFFSDLLQVYKFGHFPCGWDGDWPTGKLCIF